MLQAMCTGHDGSLSTGHANSTTDMIRRIETMVLMGLNINLEAIRGQIAGGLDILIHLGRLRDGSRKVLEISEVVGMEHGQVLVNKLYEFKEKGMTDGRIEGKLEPTGQKLTKWEKWLSAGFEKEECIGGEVESDSW